ncbi:MAG TPA: methyltransferase domain-containing protein, partial [Candidatus Methanoperedenaceae archaeon]|nr:methyltransferase domain-containing protein [Candidatus Methanoperedenaceae archaeon]
ISKVLRENDIFLEIGCGTGAVAIEAAKFAKKVYAVDRRTEAISTARSNIEEAGSPGNIELIEGVAPEVLHGMPVPDSAFIGGTANLEGVLAYLCDRAGRIAVNAVRIETAAIAIKEMRRLGIFREALQVHISRGYELEGGTAFRPDNPVYVVIGGRLCL